MLNPQYLQNCPTPAHSQGLRSPPDALAGRALSCLELGAREAAASSVASLRSVDPDHPLLGVLEEALDAGGFAVAPAEASAVATSRPASASRSRPAGSHASTWTARRCA